MKKNHFVKLVLIFLATVCALMDAMAQNNFYQYEPNAERPFGMLNPAAPKQLADFAPMIGECDCKSVARKADQTWADSVDMVWRFKYIMNGLAVQDETLKADGLHSGSIRQYNADSLSWFVTYYSTASSSSTPGVWTGNKKDEDIILYRQQKAPNGAEGFYRLSFYDISNQGFNWKGEWVSKDESFVYPTWLIFCKKKIK